MWGWSNKFNENEDENETFYASNNGHC
jgi:hypothetical protein